MFELIWIQKDDRTPLHWAASGGHVAIIDFLKSRGADINAVDEVCTCPLWKISSCSMVDTSFVPKSLVGPH